MLGSDVTFATAFVAGLVAFLSPCVVPLVPVYAAYVGGAAAGSAAAPSRRASLYGLLLFSAGFLTVFLLLGASASGLGHLLLLHRATLLRLGGAALIVFGVLLLELPFFPSLLREARIQPRRWTRMHWLNAFVLGLTFGFAWTPCIGPVLGSILFLASTAGSVALGMAQLFVFGLGIVVPLLTLGFFLERGMGLLRRWGRLLAVVQRAAALLLVACGIALLTGSFGTFVGFVERVTHFAPAL